MKIINQKKRQILIRTLFGLIAVSFCTSCVDKFEKIEKYQRPDWLEGKIYTQISSEDNNMNIFSKFMEDVGYDKVVDKTGTYAAFVPNDSVMSGYLIEKFGTADPDQIDSVFKSDIVSYHILQMPWSKTQLQTLSSQGWIDLGDISNNKPTAFKRMTLLREPTKTYNVKRLSSNGVPYDIILPNDANTGTKYKVYKETSKFAPLFFDGFMNARQLSGDDYSYYFNRQYENGELFYVNAKVIGDEIFAENGFIYEIDRVVEPLKNVEEILEDGPYGEFLQLIHNNSVFKYNEPATLAQEGADEGARVDSLYDLSYPDLPFSIHDEEINSFENTLESHNGVLAPSDIAMEDFFNEYLSGYGSWNGVPEFIRQLFLEAHLVENPIYPKDIRDGFYNGNNDIVLEEDLSINEVEFASNGTFIGLDKTVVPKFFTSVSAPLILGNQYSSFFYSYVATGLIYTLKDPDTEYSLFIEDDQSIADDSTIFLSIEDRGVSIKGYDMAEDKLVPMMGREYRDIFKRRLYGHIGIQPLLGLAKREFIETIDGRHIVVQNDTVSGGVPSEFGFNSGRDTTVVFTEITNFSMTNGKAYQCDGWLKFTNARIFNYFRNTKFLKLLDKLGMANISNEKLPFIDESERYTIFLPSDEALEEIDVDTYSIEEIEKLVSFHIVKGDFIFTDGRQNMGSYRTYDNNFINLDPEPDNLIILDENYDVYYDDLKLSSKSNLMGMTLKNIDEDYYITNAVVHRIDKVIMPY